jgi:hypothetical protein
MKIKITEENLNDYEISLPVKIRIIKEHYQKIAEKTNEKKFKGKTKKQISQMMRDVRLGKKNYGTKTN